MSKTVKGNKFISIKVDLDDRYNNLRDFDELVELMNTHGFGLFFNHNEHGTYLFAVEYDNVNRNAGRHRKFSYRDATDGKTEQSDRNNKIPVTYKDVLLMMETKNDIEIYTELKMSRSTYYRRKKEMLDYIKECNNLEKYNDHLF